MHGWEVERVQAGDSLAQVLFRRRGPFTIAYLPRGPACSNDPANFPELLKAIDDVCVRRRVATLIIDPASSLPDLWMAEGGDFLSGAEAIQTPRTVKVPLREDEALLAQMRKDMRYNIRYAQRQGVVVERAEPNETSLLAFYSLLEETSGRNDFGIHNYDYYRSFVQTLGEYALLTLARLNGEVTAGLISVRFGAEGRTMYAGSSDTRRTRGDAALLRFEAMRWARDHGCSRFDLGGIAPEYASMDGRETRNIDRRVTTLQGVNHFKVGFGGDIVTYPPALERPYNSLLAWGLRRLRPRVRWFG